MRQEDPKRTGSNPESESSKTAYRAFGLVTAIGADLVGCILGGLYLGKWIDSKLGTTPWLMVLGILLGLAVGIFGIFKMTQVFYKES